jgi:hypothetical protein
MSEWGILDNDGCAEESSLDEESLWLALGIVVFQGSFAVSSFVLAEEIAHPEHLLCSRVWFDGRCCNDGKAKVVGSRL